MKKVFTIFFSVIVLLSGMTLNYSAHYCQGNFIASRLSLTGKNADCGMDGQKGENKDVRFSNLMCVNEISSFTFSTDYVYTPQVHDSGNDFHYIDLSSFITAKINVIPASAGFSHIPPGSPGLIRAECEVLCVFRI